MSHVLDPQSVTDRDRIKITNLEAVKLAMESLGLHVLTDIEEQTERGVENPVPGRGRYRGHKTEWGRLVGDYPIPKGWTLDDVDNNAYLVGKMPEELVQKLSPSMTQRAPYDLGIVWSEEDQCYYPCYDFADTGGYLMQQVLGKVQYGEQRYEISSAYSKLMQAYHEACTALVALEQQQQLVWYTEGQTTPEGFVVPEGEKVSYVVLEE